MEDLSLHILDVVENSITAGAREVGILIDEDNAENRLSLEITDNGKGMDEEMRSKVLDPFFTTRTTRRVGLGSAPGRGTTVRAVFQIGHPDLKPLGDVASTLGAILAGRPELELKFVHRLDGEIVASLDSTLSEAKRSE